MQNILIRILLGSITFLKINAVNISVIRNVTLVSRSSKTTTVHVNKTRQECLCILYNQSALAFHYFNQNQSCEIFHSYPSRYRLESFPSIDLYFPSGIFPNESQQCMSNWTELRTQISSAAIISMNIQQPRCLVLDDNGYLVTLSYPSNELRRFNTQNLVQIDSKHMPGSKMMNMVYRSGAYYVTLQNSTILVINSSNLVTLGTINSPTMMGSRDILFLENGDIMVVAASLNQSLTFLNRYGPSKYDYRYNYSIRTIFPNPHGLAYINDSFFYVTSWSNGSVYSYSRNSSGFWEAAYFIKNNISSTFGSHITFDSFSRVWISTNNQNTFNVHERDGSFIETIRLNNMAAFDTLITNDYIFFVSDLNGNAIHRIDLSDFC